MGLEVLSEIISDYVLLEQGFRVHDGYIFKAIRHPANVFDAILIRNPSSAFSFGDRMATSSHSLGEHIEYINKHKLEKAVIIAHDISFLDQCPTLKHLNIVPVVSAEDHFDFSPLYRLSNIKSLRCAANYGKFGKNRSIIDYSRIQGLEDICVVSEDDINFQCIPTLKKLSVSQHGGSNLRGLFCSQHLDTLEIHSCSIRTLDGIEAAPQLQCLYLDNNRKLQDIGKLADAKHTLRALRIVNCSRICDLNVLALLENLEYLFLKGIPRISNLSFLKTMSNLKTLVFDMEIEDGDLSPCMNLSYVHCGKIRKHYNVKAKDLPKGIYYRGNDNIEPWRRVQ